MNNQRKSLIDEFIHINSYINLSAIRDPKEIYIKHIQDSLEINKIIQFYPKKKLCDVGTGGGFPLLPIAITNPHIQCIGIDSTQKKINAINKMINILKISNAKAIRTRAEHFQETFDYVTARAVSYIDTLLPQIHHLIKKEGILILYKRYTKEEDTDIHFFAKKYHFTLKKKYKYKLFDGDIQRIIYIRKKN